MRRFCIITDSFPPAKNSAAKLMYDLSLELSKKYFTDVYSINATKVNDNNMRIISFNFRSLKNKNYFYRAFLEIVSSFYYICMFILVVRKKYTDIIYYNPTILQVLFIKFLKLLFPNAKFSLILRDIFPDWAVHTGILNNKSLISILTYFQYQNVKLADVTYCESLNKLSYMQNKYPKFRFSLMYNWLKVSHTLASNKLKVTKPKLIYAGNVGLAQNLLFYSDYIKTLLKDGVQIDFYASGDQLSELKLLFDNENDLRFFRLVHNESLNEILSGANGGLVFLEPNHKLDNIPGKILSYLSVGLPVFGFVNKGNELIDIINKNNLGGVWGSIDDIDTANFSNYVIHKSSSYNSKNIAQISQRLFSLETALKKILN